MQGKKSIEYYDNLGMKYDFFAEKANYKSPEIIYRLLKKNGLKDKISLLDIGIGTGLCSERFTNKNIEVTGIDGSQKLLDECKEKGFEGELILADLSTGLLPIHDKAFDIFICSGIFEFIHEPLTLFSEIKRLATSNFVLALTVRTADANKHFETIVIGNKIIDKNVYDVTGVKCIHYSDKDILDFVFESDLKIIDSYTYDAYVSPNNNSITRNKLYVVKNER